MQEGGHSFARRLHQATDSLADAAFLARMNGSASREDIKGSYSKNGALDGGARRQGRAAGPVSV